MPVILAILRSIDRKVIVQASPGIKQEISKITKAKRGAGVVEVLEYLCNKYEALSSTLSTVKKIKKERKKKRKWGHHFLKNIQLSKPVLPINTNTNSYLANKIQIKYISKLLYLSFKNEGELDVVNITDINKN
jgi:hypothetical protein